VFFKFEKYINYLFSSTGPYVVGLIMVFRCLRELP